MFVCLAFRLVGGKGGEIKFFTALVYMRLQKPCYRLNIGIPGIFSFVGVAVITTVADECRSAFRRILDGQEVHALIYRRIFPVNRKKLNDYKGNQKDNKYFFHIEII